MNGVLYFWAFLLLPCLMSRNETAFALSVGVSACLDHSPACVCSSVFFCACSCLQYVSFAYRSFYLMFASHSLLARPMAPIHRSGCFLSFSTAPPDVMSHLKTCGHMMSSWKVTRLRVHPLVPASWSPSSISEQTSKNIRTYLLHCMSEYIRVPRLEIPGHERTSHSPVEYEV